MSTSFSGNDADAQRTISVTPAGCHHAIESARPGPVQRLLQRILCQPVTPVLADYGDAERKGIVRLHDVGLVDLDSSRKSLPESSLSDLLPDLLPALSERGKVVLTESKQGLFVDYAGVSREEAEELAGLAASLLSVSEKRTQVLGGKLSIGSRAFGIVDPAGNSEIGFWPLHIHEHVFTLIIVGLPRFNTPQFSTLVWALIQRYGSTESGS